MNILLINHYAGSPDMGMEFRPYYMAREWVKAGHDVTIVAGDYSHLRIKNPDVQRDFQEEAIDGIRYVWVKTGEYEGNGSARAFTMFRFVHKLKAHAAALVRDYKPDVVIASSTYPLDTYAAQKIAKLANAKYVHEIHDMWPITLIEMGGMSRSHPFVALMQRAENSFCKNANCVVSILPAADTYLVKHGMNPDNYIAVPNGIVIEEWDNPEPLPFEHQNVFDQLNGDGSFTIGFFGSLTRLYSLDYLVEAAARVDDARLAIVLVGKGNYECELKEMVNRIDTKTRFFILPPVPKAAAPGLFLQSDCLYIGAMKNDMLRFGIGMNKLFDSMMAGKPILYAVEAPNNYIEDYSCGLTVDAESTDALIAGIKQMMEFDDVTLSTMGENGRRAAIDNFSYERIASRFIRALEA